MKQFNCLLAMKFASKPSSTKEIHFYAVDRFPFGIITIQLICDLLESYFVLIFSYHLS